VAQADARAHTPPAQFKEQQESFEVHVLPSVVQTAFAGAWQCPPVQVPEQHSAWPPQMAPFCVHAAAAQLLPAQFNVQQSVGAVHGEP
jgi:hypothetical protein